MKKLDSVKETNRKILETTLGTGIVRLLNIDVLENILEVIPYSDITRCSFSLTVTYSFREGKLIPLLDDECHPCVISLTYKDKNTGKKEKTSIADTSLLKSVKPNGEDACIELLSQIRQKTTDQLVEDIFDNAKKDNIEITPGEVVSSLVKQAEVVMKSNIMKNVDHIVLIRASVIPTITYQSESTEKPTTDEDSERFIRVHHDKSKLYHNYYGTPIEGQFTNDLFTVNQAVFTVENGVTSKGTTVEQFQVKTHEELRELVFSILSK